MSLLHLFVLAFVALRFVFVSLLLLCWEDWGGGGFTLALTYSTS